MNLDILDTSRASVNDQLNLIVNAVTLEKCPDGINTGNSLCVTETIFDKINQCCPSYDGSSTPEEILQESVTYYQILQNNKLSLLTKAANGSIKIGNPNDITHDGNNATLMGKINYLISLAEQLTFLQK